MDLTPQTPLKNPPKGLLQKDYIPIVSDFLSKSSGFIVINLTLLVGTICMWWGVISENTFTFWLSLAAIIISAFVLVSQRKTELSMNLKLDHLIAASEAHNRIIGAEHQTIKEIEIELEEIEKAP